MKKLCKKGNMIIKRIMAFALVFAMTFLFCACGSGETTNSVASLEKATVSTTENYKNNTRTSAVPSESTYEQGETGQYDFASEWLGLRFESHGLWKSVDLNGLKAMNDNAKATSPKKYTITEMYFLYNKQNAPALQINTTKLTYNKDVKSLAEENIQALKDTYTDMDEYGYTVEASFSGPTNYTFLGEQYLMYTHETKTYYGTTLTNEGKSWLLYRVKEDRLVRIYCSSGEEYTSLDSMLNLFTNY